MQFLHKFILNLLRISLTIPTFNPYKLRWISLCSGNSDSDLGCVQGVMKWPSLVQHALGRVLEKQNDWLTHPPNQSQLHTVLRLYNCLPGSYSESSRRALGAALGVHGDDPELLVWLQNLQKLWNESPR